MLSCKVFTRTVGSFKARARMFEGLHWDEYVVGNRATDLETMLSYILQQLRRCNTSYVVSLAGGNINTGWKMGRERRPERDVGWRVCKQHTHLQITSPCPKHRHHAARTFLHLLHQFRTKSEALYKCRHHHQLRHSRGGTRVGWKDYTHMQDVRAKRPCISEGRRNGFDDGYASEGV